MDEDNDPSLWCPLSRTIPGDFLLAVDVWPSPEQAALGTDPKEVERNLDLVYRFDPTTDRANLNMPGRREFHPNWAWLLRYAVELRRMLDA